MDLHLYSKDPILPTRRVRHMRYRLCLGDDAVAVVQADGQGRGAQLGPQDPALAGTHATKGKRTHGNLGSNDVRCVELLMLYHVLPIKLERTLAGPAGYG
jgi:hypothetical protein